MVFAATMASTPVLSACSTAAFEASALASLVEYGLDLAAQDAPQHAHLANAANVFENPQPLLASVIQSSDTLTTPLEAAVYFKDNLMAQLGPDDVLPSLMDFVMEPLMGNAAPLAADYSGELDERDRIAQYFERLADVMRLGMWRLMAAEGIDPTERINKPQLARLQTLAHPFPFGILQVLGLSEKTDAFRASEQLYNRLPPEFRQVRAVIYRPE